MGGGGSAQQSSSSYGSGWSKIEVPEAIKPLYKQSADYLMQLQKMIPLWGTSTTTAKPGTTPAYSGPQAAPASSGVQGDLYVDADGIMRSAGAKHDPGGSYAYRDINTGEIINIPGGEGLSLLPQTNEAGQWVDKEDQPGGGQVWQRQVGDQELGPMGSFPQYQYLERLNWTPYSQGTPAAAGAAQPGFNTSGLIPIKNPDGTTSYYNPQDVMTEETSPNFLGANPMQVAPLDPLQDWAAARSPEVWNTPETETQARLYATLAPIMAGRMATGAGVGTDPAVLAASEAFEKMLAPRIENQMGLAGLGKSSSLANALGLSKTSYMLPLIQDYISREQGTLTNQANMYGSMVPQLAGLGSSETARRLQAINAAAQMGGTRRAAAQEPFTAQYQDFLRRQALAEQALFVPFGATATASIGPESEWSQTSSGSGSQSSGMFK